METLWSLGHKKLKSVEKNLYSNQVAQKVIEGLKNGGSENDWVVWKVGWSQWKHIVEVEDLLAEIQLLQKINEQTADADSEAPPLEFNTTTSMNSDQNIDSKYAPTSTPKLPTSAPIVPNLPNKNDTPNLVAETPNTTAQTPVKSGIEQRKHKRFEVRLRCIIRSETLTFRTFTKNISLGGVALEDAIPSDFIGTECNIYITAINFKKNLKFKIQMVQRPEPKFFSFDFVQPEFLAELNLWLADYENSASATKAS